MNNRRSAPNDFEFDALAALADDHMDVFVARAVRLVGASGNKYRLLLLTKDNLPLEIVEVVIEDQMVEALMPKAEEDVLMYKVVDIVCCYLDSDDQELFQAEVAVVAARRSTSRLSGWCLERFVHS